MTEKAEPLRDIIYNELVDSIIRGNLNAGERLSERDLAERFHCSRTPVREALLQLEKGGYIVHKKNVGGVVKKITAEGVEEILHVVGVLEGNAVELAAMKPLKKKDITYLTKLHKQMVQLAGARNYSKYIELNEKFHKFFVDECGNTTLKNIVNDLRNKAYGIRALGFTLPLHIDEYITSHEAIIEAIVQNNPVEAGIIMKDHVFRSKTLRAIALRDYAYA